MSRCFFKDYKRLKIAVYSCLPNTDCKCNCSPLAVKPEEPPRPNKRNTGFWDNFATKWQQAAAMKQAEAAESGGDAQEEEIQSGSRAEENQEGEAGDTGAGNSFSKYATLAEGSEETPTFKWNFVTSKLAELKTRSMAKSN